MQSWKGKLCATEMRFLPSGWIICLSDLGPIEVLEVTSRVLSPRMHLIFLKLKSPGPRILALHLNWLVTFVMRCLAGGEEFQHLWHLYLPR